MNIYNLEKEKNNYINLKNDIINICNDINKTYDIYEKYAFDIKEALTIDEDSLSLNKIIKNKNNITNIRDYLLNVVLIEIDNKIRKINNDIENCKMQEVIS